MERLDSTLERLAERQAQRGDTVRPVDVARIEIAAFRTHSLPADTRARVARS